MSGPGSNRLKSGLESTAPPVAFQVIRLPGGEVLEEGMINIPGPLLTRGSAVLISESAVFMTPEKVTSPSVSSVLPCQPRLTGLLGCKTSGVVRNVPLLMLMGVVPSAPSLSIWRIPPVTEDPAWIQGEPRNPPASPAPAMASSLRKPEGISCLPSTA